jgi:hypothetical protein
MRRASTEVGLPCRRRLEPGYVEGLRHARQFAMRGGSEGGTWAWYGHADAMGTLIRRTLAVAVPIFKSLRGIVPAVTVANRIVVSAIRRSASSGRT